mmetsp:Transcript_83695/g.210951  ORF Transcript_83695/g.210951 Transcript_83695/m.210951 type:complete len:200 (+) Transcript_83695:285-884(+)
MNAKQETPWAGPTGSNCPVCSGGCALAEAPGFFWTLPLGKFPFMPTPRLCAGCANLHRSWYRHQPLFFQWQHTIPRLPTLGGAAIFVLAWLLHCATSELEPPASCIRISLCNVRSKLVAMNVSADPKALYRDMGAPASVAAEPVPCFALTRDPSMCTPATVAAASNFTPLELEDFQPMLELSREAGICKELSSDCSLGQ